MNLKIKLVPIYVKNIVLTEKSFHSIQSLIYSKMNENTRNFLYNNGYYYEKRKFKLFNFGISNFSESFKRNKKKYIFKDYIELQISSVDNKVIEEIANNLLFTNEVKIDSNILKKEEVSIIENKVLKNGIKVKAITPVTVYSTHKTILNNKKTVYYNPKDKEFIYYIKENLRKKWQAFSKEKEFNKNLNIEIIEDEYTKKYILYFKDTIIEGYCTKFCLKSDDLEYLKFILNVGLGSKSSQGFGFIQKMED